MGGGDQGAAPAIRATREVGLEAVFRLWTDDLVRLNDAFAAFCRPVEYEIGCADGLERTLPTVEAVCAYDNPPSRQIRRLTVRAMDVRARKHARLTFDSTRERNIWVSLEGPEDLVQHLNDAIEQRLVGVTPWYARITTARLGLGGAIVGILALTLSLLSLAAAWVRRAGVKLDDPSRNALASGAAIAGIVIMWIVAASWRRVRDALFPRGVFLIGQGVERDRFKETMRWIVVPAAVGSIVAASWWVGVEVLNLIGPTAPPTGP